MEEVARLEAIKPKAAAADHVSKFLVENDISHEDFAHILNLGAAMRRGDLRTFYEGVKPYMELAEQYMGVSLPPDLQQRVAEGHMTTQAAAAFSKERMDRALAENYRQRMEFANQTDAAQRQQKQLEDAVVDHVNAWERQTMQKDPDYLRKAAAVQLAMKGVVFEKGRPQTPGHAVAIANEAYRRVNDQYKTWQPQPRPTSRAPSSTGRTNGAAPEPKNLFDVVKQARERARA
jgi:hypothetical protein